MKSAKSKIPEAQFMLIKEGHSSKIIIQEIMSLAMKSISFN
jgi:hypothetical protein